MKKKDQQRIKTTEKSSQVRVGNGDDPEIHGAVAEPPAVGPPGGRERRFRHTNLPPGFVERRKHPLISTEPPPPPPPPRMEDYAAIIGMPELDEIRFLARHLRGKGG